MALVVLAPLVAALAAAVVGWHYATELDRQSVQERGQSETVDARRLWRLVLGTLVAAVAAVTIVQTALLAGLRSLTE